MKGHAIQRGETPRFDLWKESLREQLAGRGRKAALARYLCDGDEDRLAGRVVQIAKVLNQGAIPEAEFVLAVNEWLATSLHKDGEPKLPTARRRAK